MPTQKPKILITLEEDFRFENRINSRSEAIRRLIEKGLKSSEGKTKTKEK